MTDRVLNNPEYTPVLAKTSVKLHSIYFGRDSSPGRFEYWVFEHIGNLIFNHCQFVTIDYDQIMEMLPEKAKNMGRSLCESPCLLETWVEV